MLKHYFPGATIIAVGNNPNKVNKKEDISFHDRNIKGMIETFKSINISEITDDADSSILLKLGAMIACVNTYNINDIENKEIRNEYNKFLIKTKNIINKIFNRNINRIANTQKKDNIKN